MFNLIYKDMLIQKKNIIFSFIYMIFMIIAFGKMASFVFAWMFIGIPYLFISTSFAIDDKNKSDILLNSLPIHRRDIVAAKYLSLFVCVAMGIIVYLLISTMTKAVGLPIKIFPINSELAIGTFFAVSLMSSVYLPVLFKYGYTKSKVFHFIIFFAFFFGASSIKEVFKEVQDVALFNNVIAFFTTLADIQISLLVIGTMLTILLISYVLSVRFYMNREF